MRIVDIVVICHHFHAFLSCVYTRTTDGLFAPTAALRVCSANVIAYVGLAIAALRLYRKLLTEALTIYE